jgi:hypothetical protein
MIKKYMHCSRPFEGMWTGATYIEVDDNEPNVITAVWPNGRRLSMTTMNPAIDSVNAGFWVP